VASILVVEDDEHVRVLVESFLADEGHQTLSASTPEQATALLESNAEVDLMLVDVTLNGDVHAGLTLAQSAVEKRPKLKVLYTTGQGITDGMRALFVKNSAFVPKPFSIDQLKKALVLNFEIRSSGAN
jgi:DNA-binding NtrC family response regulator